MKFKQQLCNNQIKSIHNFNKINKYKLINKKLKLIRAMMKNLSKLHNKNNKINNKVNLWTNNRCQFNQFKRQKCRSMTANIITTKI